MRATWWVVTLNEKPGIVLYVREKWPYRMFMFWPIDANGSEPNKSLKLTIAKTTSRQWQRTPSVRTELGGSIEEDQAQQRWLKFVF